MALAQRSTPRSPHDSLLTPPSVSVSSTPADYEADDEIDDLLCRIQDGIEYERAQRNKGEAIKQSTRFEVLTTPSTALTLLRRYATLIWASATHEVYELGVLRPDWVTEGILPGIHDPQWWVNKSLAEIKAGPHAEESDIKRATATLKALQTKQSKKKLPTAREKEIDWKLREGFRRQEKGLSMWDDSEVDKDQSNKSNEATHSKFSNSESDDSEDQMPVRRGIRQAVRKARSSRAQPLMSDSEEEVPRRVVRRMAAKVPQRRARPVVDDTESEYESEEDIPIMRDPRYLQFKLQQHLRS